MQQCDELRSIRDLNFNAALAALADWKNEQPELPDWFNEKTARLRTWRSCARLAALCLYWRDHRFPGDEEAFTALEGWRKHDKHLYEWQENLRAKVLERRRDIYRNFAARMRRQYSTAVIEKLDLRKFHRLAEPDEEPTSKTQYLRVAALSVLVSCLKESLVVETVDPANTTRTCHACGSLEDWDQAQFLRHKCGQCGAEWDQDQNAARNLLASGEVVAGVE